MAKSTNIDRSAYEPAYVQLVNILQGQIASGKYRPGSQLPAEAYLCKRYKVSPMTVRRSINVLRDQGIVTTTQGLGTFVKHMDLGEVTFNLDEFQGMFGDGEEKRVQILEARIVSANERTARKLSVEVGSRMVYIRRLLFDGEVPVLYHEEYLVYDPTRPIVEAEMEATSLKGLFSGSSITDLKGGRLTIEATTLTKAEAEMLHGTPGEAAFRLAHTFYDFEDRPFSWGWFITQSKRLRFQTTVGIRD